MSLPTINDPRFQRLGLKLALFVGAGVLLVLAITLTMAVRQGYFSPKTRVRFLAESGTDLRPGMAVKLSGFKIGEVSTVELNQQARVDVEMQIETRYLKWIKRDSVATLAREGMIGDSFISVSSGTPALPPLSTDERLRFVAGSSLGDIAIDVRNRVIPVIDELHRFLSYTNDPKGDIRASFRALHELAVQLQQTRKEVDATLVAVNQLARDDAPATLAQTRATLERADASLAALEKSLPELSAQASRSLTQLDAATGAATTAATQAGDVMKDAGPRLDRTLVEAEALLRESRAAVSAARGHWPFKGADPVPATEAPAAPVAPEPPPAR
ncbi:MAG TPA: MlaD family protein [Moraxellaceae bacterium]|nr:MlaD family protein [Moraxellaceae bacterium]